jgi:SAM-dependent methyltransferase
VPRLILSERDIAQLYADKVAVNDAADYRDRYRRYDFHARFGEKLAAFDFPRLITILEFERLVAKYGVGDATNVLMLNGGAAGDPELQALNYRHVDTADYEADPDHYDLHAPAFARADYDFVLLSQTLEHLYDPGQALEQLYAAITPGGYIWASVPTVSQLHQLPQHFTTGFTPIGLVCLFAHLGFEIVEGGQWGNARYINHSFALGGFPTYYDLARPQWRGARHLLWTLGAPVAWRRQARRWFRLSPADWLLDGLRNDFWQPAQTWVLARRPAPAGDI